MTRQGRPQPDAERRHVEGWGSQNHVVRLIEATAQNAKAEELQRGAAINAAHFEALVDEATD